MLHEHAVAFYDDDREIADAVARFIADGIPQQSSAIVVVTPAHGTAIEKALQALGLDPDEPPIAGNLVILDARRTLTGLMSPDGPDIERFTDAAARMLRDAGSDGAPVRIYGEMVDLLWKDGDTAGALALEGLWNDLLQRVDFDLLCGYSASLVDSGVLADVHAVCGHHSEVRAPARHLTLDRDQATSPRVFLPVSEAVASSRQFVETCLRQMGAADHLVHDARTVVSELATNAVRHAAAPFRVSVDEGVGLVCISVEDLGGGHAAQRFPAPGEHPLDGRGIEIVDGLTQRWGCDLFEAGKVVWAELAA